mmetsp:Transcript_817/g.1344  ORF Transcript_817/g.1344 Transcript_817/m.1344 type:complete len:270 (+) Transcript_817:1139-1948(+)
MQLGVLWCLSSAALILVSGELKGKHSRPTYACGALHRLHTSSMASRKASGDGKSLIIASSSASCTSPLASASSAAWRVFQYCSSHQMKDVSASTSNCTSCACANSCGSRFFGSGGARSGQLRMKGAQHESPARRRRSTLTASCTFHGRWTLHAGGSPGNGFTAGARSSRLHNVRRRGTSSSTSPGCADLVFTSPRTPPTSPTHTAEPPPSSSTHRSSSSDMVFSSSLRLLASVSRANVLGMSVAAGRASERISSNPCAHGKHSMNPKIA